MKNILIAAITTLACTFSFAQSTAIEGNWGTTQQFGGITFDITFSISKSSITLTNVCSGFGTSAIAQITTASTYTDTTISVLEAKQDQKSNGPLNCEVGSQIDTMNYSLQGDQLIFTHDGSPDSLVLIKK